MFLSPFRDGKKRLDPFIERRGPGILTVSQFQRELGKVMCVI